MQEVDKTMIMPDTHYEWDTLIDIFQKIMLHEGDSARPTKA